MDLILPYEKEYPMDNGASSYRRFLDGDKDAFADLIGMYARNLIFFIHRMVGNVTVSEDLAEDTFCDLIFYQNRFKEKSLFKTYLFSIARNKAVDYLKRNAKAVPFSDDEMERQLDETDQLECTVLQNERDSQINKALRVIHTDYRAVLHLLYFDDVPYDQAAVILKKSKKQMHDLVYRAKQALKAEMEKEGFTYEE